MTKLFITLFFIASLYFNACAQCTCQAPNSIADVAGTAIHVFDGTVTRSQVQKVNLKFDVVSKSYYETYVTFKIDTLYKGKCGDTIEVVFVDGDRPCDKNTPDFTFGDHYRVSTLAPMKKQAPFYNNYCCLRKKIVKGTPIDSMPAQILPQKKLQKKTKSKSAK
jgi:hypothetical protein